MDKIYTALGFMTGTSMDGIDVALLETDGKDKLIRKEGLYFPYGVAVRDKIEEAAELAQKATTASWPYTGDAHIPQKILSLRADIVETHANSAAALLDELGLRSCDIDVVGYHGQTLLHRPDIGFTYQLADGAALAAKMIIPVVCDFRLNDMQHQGEGAPLAPIYHKALVTQLIHENRLRPGAYVFVNIGGVANITYISESGDLLAFDTGPGNALLDDWISHHTGAKFDEDGELSLAGRVDDDWCRRMMAHEYFDRSPPKSIDRDHFKDVIASLQDQGCILEDGAASLVELTAKSIAASATHFGKEPLGWIVAGGGQHNPAMLERIESCVGTSVMPANALGLDGDLIEAECFAYLAVRSKLGLPISYPGTTGVERPVSGGVTYNP